MPCMSKLSKEVGVFIGAIAMMRSPFPSSGKKKTNSTNLVSFIFVFSFGRRREKNVLVCGFFLAPSWLFLEADVCTLRLLPCFIVVVVGVSFVVT